MKLPTKIRYGMRAMVELARLEGGQPVLLRSIAERQRLPEKYLEHLFTQLRTAGLVKSERGARGGYHLARPSEKITALDIYLALGGERELIACVERPEECGFYEACPTVHLWRELGAAIRRVLEEKTLKDLASLETSAMYFI